MVEVAISEGSIFTVERESIIAFQRLMGIIVIVLVM